jgi:glycerophosphoryl diester phosphodiesterase
VGGLSFMPIQAVEIIAHRGGAHDAPENTVAAARLAWQQNADAVEVDVHLSRDGRLVVIHDHNTKRTAGVSKKVVDQTLDELRALDAGTWKGPQWKGERIPTLDQVLATVPAGKRLFVEIKCGPEALDEFGAALRRSKPKDARVVVISFNYDVVKQTKARFPELEACWIADFKRTATGGWKPEIASLIQKAQAAELDGLDLSYRGPLDAASARTIRAAGLKLFVWTVDSASAARRLREAGVDGITTNRPGWLRAELETRTSR